MAALIFGAWKQDNIVEKSKDGGLTTQSYILIVLDVLLLAHGALVILPLYVLTATAGSHSQDEVIE